MQMSQKQDSHVEGIKVVVQDVTMFEHYAVNVYPRSCCAGIA
jgi:hypothetical protein